MKKWTTKELKILNEYYRISPQTCMGMLKIKIPGFNRTYSAVKNKAKVLGISRKHNETGRYEKGTVPWNKGKKTGSHPNCEHTQFKPGEKPHNTKHVGVIVVREMKKTKTMYQWYKHADRKWEMYHRVVWRRANGEIPKGMIVVFKDGDTMNTNLNNLELITRQENLRRNHNRKKFRETCEQITDRQVAKHLAYHDPELRQELLKHPDVLDIHRKKLKLERQIRKHDSK